MRSPAPPLALGVLALALVGAGPGCGQAARVGGGRMLRVALSEYRLNPQSVRVSEGRLTIAISNFGRLTHNLVLSRSGQTIASSKPIAPGQSAQINVVVRRGTYLMASTILSDQALGEYGTLSVTR